jgi:hypothetical protein
MNRKTIGIALILIFFSYTAFSQRRDSLKIHLNHYSLAIGTGWTHYINNLKNGDQKIRQDFAGLSFKFSWEPEYRLSLGLETGYYKLFKVTNQVRPDTSLEVSRNIIPLMLLVRMRIVDHLYLTAGMGLAIIYNKVSIASDKITTKTWSFSNYDFTTSYIYPVSRHWQIGGEVKMYNFGNLNDWMYALHMICAFRF